MNTEAQLLAPAEPRSLRDAPDALRLSHLWRG